jgi:hypothetical protein
LALAGTTGTCLLTSGFFNVFVGVLFLGFDYGFDTGRSERCTFLVCTSSENGIPTAYLKSFSN